MLTSELIDSFGRAVDRWEYQVGEATTDASIAEISPSLDNRLGALQGLTRALAAKQTVIHRGLALSQRVEGDLAKSLVTYLVQMRPEGDESQARALWPHLAGLLFAERQQLLGDEGNNTRNAAILPIKKSTLRDVLGVGETTLRTRIRNGTIIVADRPRKYAKVVQLDIRQFTLEQQEQIRRKSGLDTFV
jgi:hypothetical protein